MEFFLQAMKTIVRRLLVLAVTACATLAAAQTAKLGIFSQEADIGNVARPGSVSFDPATGEYRISGGGGNMWFTNDAFHFAWKEMSGDFRLTADIQWLGTGGNSHRKACLLVRQSLNGDSPYADVAVHGSGLTSLQYRDLPGADTHEIQSDISAPTRVRLEKRGNYMSMWTAPAGRELKPAGGYMTVPITGTFFVGLGVCAHDNSTIESAVFSHVTLEPVLNVTNTPATLECSLETVAIASTDRTIIYRTRDHIEAPNWSRDGKFFLFNSQGRIYRLPAAGGTPEPLSTGFAVNCNNDHGISPDGKLLAVSDGTLQNKSRIYVVPIEGGIARQITPLGPSYWHGWSPDGRTLAFCGQRNGNFDIYTIAATGGQETRLTTAPGLDDGPDYSPDGKFIYFNSERSGTMQIWRMKTDGSGQQPVTADGYNNWFAHPSPDDKWIVFLSFEKDVVGHPPNKDVLLRLMPVGGGEIRVLARLFGGQGTMNVPSWSPDSKNVAFVSYQRVYQ
jgi:hypothetical protein